MKRLVKEGQSFFNFYLGQAPTAVANGEISPYISLETWGNGYDTAASKEFGQVATPAAIANLMAKWVTSGNPRIVLDPAAGLGNLLFEVHQLCPSARLIGVEHESSTHEKATRAAPSGTTLLHADYLKSQVERADGIIANPPYVKAHHLDYTEADWSFFEEVFGLRLDRLTNLYALFLLKIWDDLAQDGRAAVIIPAEFLNANFGVQIKRRLLTSIRPVGMAVFDPSFSVFDTALTTSCILFLHKTRQRSSPIIAQKVGSVRETSKFLDSLLRVRSLNKSECMDLSSWNPADKWLNRLFGSDTTGIEQMPKRVGDYFRCLRGIATGANDYFTLSRAEIAKRKLRLVDFVPCITHATDASGLVFARSDFARLETDGKRCYLLNPKDIGSSMQAYLDEGAAKEVPRRHLPSHRPVWYLPENRKIAEIWIAVFSREYVKCILNLAGIRNLTCYHGMYARMRIQGMAEAMTLFLNSSYGRTAFSQVNRFYGDGLNKLEPKDVEAMPCPPMPDLTTKEIDALRGQLAEIGKERAEERFKVVNALTVKVFSLRQPGAASTPSGRA